jgi:CubicO group peptidase (beta-lactamase class C family)
MVKLGSRWLQAVAVLVVLGLGYQAWRSRWLWGLPEAGGDSGRIVAVPGDPVGADLDRYLSRLAAYGYSGSALVARGGRVLLHRGYGLADREHLRPYTAETLFDVASISKQFTAAAVLALEMEGRLKVEDPLGKFFPEAPVDKAGITLHQLLTHTSGLRDTFGDEYEAVTRDELLRRVWASSLLGPPGRRYRYSNGGYSVLAAVIEVASGRSYGDYLHERLFMPAGMRHSGFRVTPGDAALLARGYTADGAWGTPLDHPLAADGPWWNLRGNGGILSTTGDLYRWHLALAGDSVLARPQREKHVTPYVREGRAGTTDYAYGWSIGKSPTGKREISHIGGNSAFESDFRRYVDDDVVIVLSGNGVDFSALAIGDHLENRVFGRQDPDPPAVAAPPQDPAVPGAAEAAARCAGVYLLPPPAAGAGTAGSPGERLRVAVDPAPGAPAGSLLIAADGRQGMALLLGALAPDDRERVADRDQRVADALEAARGGHFEALARLMGVEADAAGDLLRKRLAPLKRRLGPWTGVAVQGGAARGGRWYTYARCAFERGAELAELGWEGPTVETLHFVAAAPGQRFVPESAGIFAAFDVRSGVAVRAACAPPASGGPGPAPNGPGPGGPSPGGPGPNAPGGNAGHTGDAAPAIVLRAGEGAAAVRAQRVTP